MTATLGPQRATEPGTESGRGVAPLGRRALIALAVASVAALALRLAGVAEPPLSFHPTRQYAGLQVAKARYLDLRPDAPPLELAAARANGEAAPDLEPRLLEWAVVAGYLVLGGERIWLGGALSSLLWVLGGGCLFLLARRLASDLAGGVAVGFYLFLPYGIPASRSFQPDPAMVAFILAVLVGIVRHHDDPRLRKVLLPAGLAAVAILIKPVAVFVLVGAFVALALRRDGLREGVLGRSTLVFLSIGVLPVAALYAYGILRGGGLESQAQMSFIPGLLLEGFYWRGWLRLVNLTVGVTLAVLALCSVAVARDRDARALVGGLFAGYVAYGLVFDYHISTHDYYQLQFIPIVGLGLGLTADAGYALVRRVDMSGVMKAACAVVLVPLVVLVVQADLAAARPVSRRFADQVVADAEKIGALVSHSTRTMMLAPAYGMHLAYHGDFAGSSWPSVTGGDFRLAQLQGRPFAATAELLDETIRRGTEWFVITDLHELERQPDLLPLLEQRGTLAGSTDRYLVYSLRPPGIG